ncbi:hypothetical protein T484DRAFT_2585168 [Baffinella frigidus]|nr:hypothetical protein T484DRAFT_2585168 [Cryptophyta sp. CCMP2293]
MLKDALHRASLVNARLGLPACHEPALATSNKVRRLAVAHAQSLLKEGVSALYEEACREVLRPLKARILDIVCKDLTLPPDQLAERWVTQKHSLQAACHDAVEKWGDFLLSGLRALLVQTLEVAADLGEEMKLIANPPFKLLRFASFVSAILDHLARHLQAAKRDILETVAHCALQFFDRMSPWVHIETDLESSPIMVRVRCSNVDLTEAIIFAFVRQGTAVVLQQMPLRLVEIANGVADWVEDCSQERRDTLTRMQKLEYAMNQIVSLLGAGSTEELLRTRMVGSVRGPLHPIGSHGTGPTNFQFPYGVTVDLEGRLVVADTLNNRVQVMHGNGTLHLSIGKEGSGEGSGPGEFRQPVAVTTTPAGLIAVVEQQGNRIQLFNGKGVLVRTVGKAGTGPCCFNNPAGVACDSGGMLYVADRDNNRIQVLREDGTFLRFIGSQGTGKGQVRRPVGITIDHESNLVIAEGGRVQVLRPDGRHVRYVGETSPGLLKNPVGVAVDAFGRIYISDLENHRVEVFEPEGKVHLVSIGSEGIGSGQFKAPRGIAVDRDGVVVIADCKNHRLQLFRDPIGSGRLSPDSTTALDNNRRGSGV